MLLPHMNRNAIQRIVAAWIVGWSCLVWGVAGFSQDDDKRRSELGERQRLVERNMAELEARFVRVAEALQAKEPERAKRLVDTLQQAKEKLIAKRMAEITALLDENKLDQAEKELQAVVEDLDRLVRMLLNNEREEQTAAQEIAALERWKQQIQEMRQEQHQQTRETQKVAHKDEAIKSLEEKIKQVEQLIKDQSDLITQTQNDAKSGIRAMDRLADQQFEIRQRTEALAREMGDPTDPAQEGESSDSKPSEKPNGDSAQAGGKESGNKPADESERPNEAAKNNAGENKAEQPSTKEGEKSEAGDAAGKPSAGKPSSGDARGSKAPGEAKSGDGENQPKSAGKKQPGQAPLESSQKHQQAAEENLTQGQPADAQRNQEKALDDMKAALEELNRERRRIASLPPEALAEMAKQQRRTRGKAVDLADEIAKAKPPSKNGEQTNDPQAPRPGLKPMQEAEQSMENAAGGLEEKDAERAERQQQKSEEKLDEALREIEERLSQLREETRQEKLARLEARFTEMLARQRMATGNTIELDDKKNNLSKLWRRDQLQLIRTSAEEGEIRELGQQAYDLLLEDGTSSVFPECVVDLQEDLSRVATLLESERTDQLTQLIQREIETALEDLLESLKQAKNEGGGGGGGGGGKQPLLRKSSELKMLRAAQMRVNRRTKQFEAIRGEQQLDTALKSEIDNISQRQSEITEMTEQIMEKKD